MTIENTLNGQWLDLNSDTKKFSNFEQGIANPFLIQEDADIKALAIINKRYAFDKIVRKYRDKLFQYAVYMLRDTQEAFDVTQETLIRAYTENSFFNEDFKMKAWLFRVLTNLCYNITRDKKRRTGLLDLSYKQPIEESVQAIEDMMKKETETSLMKALERIPEKYRTILLLKYYEDLSYLEIADVLGCPLGTVMSRLSRAREKLQKAMESISS